ncbi:MAG: cell surface protein SprA [Bacteroidia bacterium]
MTKEFTKYILVAGASLGMLSLIVSSDAKVDYNRVHAEYIPPQMPLDSPPPSTTPDLHFPFNDNSNMDPLNYPPGGPLTLDNPSNVNTTVDYDPTTGQYNVNQTMGGMQYRPPTYLDGEEYQQLMFNKQVKDYWNARSHAESQTAQQNTAIPKLHVGGEMFDRIFGGNTVDIRPNGSAELIFAYNGTKTQNPAIPVKNRKTNTFNFDEKIQLNVVGKIGDKLKLTTSYNTEATFDYENQMKLEYTGYEDEIIKKIEAGNVSLPLNGTLITGSQTLFGVKTQLQFGRLTITSILSQQKGKKSEVEVTGGAQVTKFDIPADQYEANKHFFLGQYFRDNYNSALANLPFVNSPINITRIEVWVSNTTAATNDIRDVACFSELGEDLPTLAAAHLTPYITDSDPGSTIPYNDQNSMYNMLNTLPTGTGTGFRNKPTASNTITGQPGNTLVDGTHFIVYNARKLQSSEYTFNAKLGFISLNQQLNPEQVLSVAYQYTLNGNVYTVGEFSDVATPVMITKMLKASTPNVKLPIWNLMMKNVYSIGAYQVNPKDFKLDVFYTNGATGTDINYLPVTDCQTAIKAKPLVQVVALDKINQQGDHTPDGVFDYIDGVTINSANGRVYFPVVEPFGDYLRSQFNSSSPPCASPTEANTYVFDPLYDSTITTARNVFASLNRFKLKGQFQSSGGSEISLGSPNVPQGSVTVTAGGVPLTENVDYTVDYTLGRVKIINEGILNSGSPIKISLESNALFAIQQKTLFGTHLDYKVNKDFNLGATILNLTERPLTKKVNIGDEPISNTIWGFDGNYRTEAPFLTRMVDKIPFIETKEMSTITAAGEFAYLVPGHSRAVGKTGNSYIDDFEGSQSEIDLHSPIAWSLASTPQGQSMFPEASSSALDYGFNRAKLCWYRFDNALLRQQGGVTPGSISNLDMSNHFTREIPETEVFPNKPSTSGTPVILQTMDLAFYPSERGPYNFDVHPTGFSSGLAPDGKLLNPESRWGGITRAVQTNDFEAANIEFIQFWVMDPFNSDNTNPSSTGELYFDIGNISEDILKDGYKSAENALPAPSTQPQNNGHNVPTDTTVWGIVPSVQPLVNAFNSDEGDRPSQDVGFDGMNNAQEQNFYNAYLSSLTATQLASGIHDDPSGDDYHYWRGDDYDLQGLKALERMKKYNGVEGNSPVTSGSYPTQSTTLPDVEDINHDNNLSTVESYYQYKVGLKPSDFTGGVGTNYITNVYHTTGQNIKDPAAGPRDITWYQFKIPIRDPNALRVGAIDNFQSIRFIRMFIKGADKPIILRFAKLELVRNDWRKYGFDLLLPGLYQPNDDPGTQFDIGAVNIEEDGSKSPVNYVLPPNIEREINTGSANLVALNEQAMSLTICGLEDGHSRAAYKTTSLDVRNYKKLKMYVHCEASANTSNPLHNDDLHLFVRLGTDYTDNYYEYEIPMKVTAPGHYNGTDIDDQYLVWPEANEMILEFEKLQAAKQKRNLAMFNGGTVTLTTEFKVADGSRTITVKGNPNLSAIKTMMIGIRNPAKMGPGDSDDGLAKCGQIWVNELRLSDFDEKGGWAATARVTAKLADFGNVSLSGNMYTPGFGSIENKLTERKKETLKQYDMSSSLELGKFLREDLNIHVPMYVGYSESFITPQYNPLDPDILLAPTLRDQSIPKDVRDSVKHVTQDYTKRRSINFTNVKKDKGKNSKKARIYDIENWSASYSYNEAYHRNVNIEYATQRNYRGGLIYSFSPQPKNIKPFQKTKIFQSKYLQLIKDVNFYLLPNKIGFATDVDRDFSASKSRNTTGGDLLILPTFNKKFTMNRNYDIKWDLTKALKLDYTATNEARILEPMGEINTGEKKDTLRNNFFQGGKTTQFNQQMGLNYNIPINKIPLLDFTSASVRVGGMYGWERAPFNADTLGNTIRNSQNVNWNGQLNMVTLYNKIPYFKKINQKSTKGKDNKGAKGTSAIKPIAKTPQEIADSTKKAKEDRMEILEYVARIIMCVKTVTITYATTDGMIMPGYGRGTTVLGMDNKFEGPSLGFVAGDQHDISQEAIDKGWLVKTRSINTPFARTSSQNLNIRANVEPLPDLKIEVTATRTQAKNSSSFTKWDGDSFERGLTPMETGNFSMSYLTYKTAFVKDGGVTFQHFLDVRPGISARLGDANQNSLGATSDGYQEGYNSTSQDVLIPAFLAAYSGKSENTISTDPFPKVPKPNWRITYDGLSKLEKIKKYFKSFTLSSAYRSSYNVGGYTRNLLWVDDGSGFTSVRETVSSSPGNPNFLPENLISTVSIAEQWSPLVKLDMTMKNSVLVSFEFKKDRNLSLGLTSKTITEVAGREIIGGLGYRIPNLTLGKAQIKGKPIKSDLNLKLDLSFRKNATVVRRIVEEVSQSTAGTNIISIKLSADYVISEKINVRLFYDRIMNKPVISSSFPTTNTNAGVSLRLTLAN